MKSERINELLGQVNTRLRNYDDVNEPDEELFECLDEIQKLQEIIRKCAETFRHYVGQHEAKISDADPKELDTILKKVERNRAMAQMCEEVMK